MRIRELDGFGIVLTAYRSRRNRRFAILALFCEALIPPFRVVFVLAPDASPGHIINALTAAFRSNCGCSRQTLLRLEQIAQWVAIDLGHLVSLRFCSRCRWFFVWPLAYRSMLKIRESRRWSTRPGRARTERPKPSLHSRKRPMACCGSAVVPVFLASTA